MRYLLAIGFILGLALTLHAQSDSTIVKQQAKYYVAHEPWNVIKVDTSLKNLEEYELLHFGGAQFHNMGNTGSVPIPLTFAPDHAINFSAGYTVFDNYRLDIDSIRHYITPTNPYTELSMIIGGSSEVVFEGVHSQKLSRTLDFGIHFQRINSESSYPNQRSLHNGLTFYVDRTSKNKVWDFNISIAYNRLRDLNNGGLAVDLLNSDSVLVTNSLAPTNLLDAQLDLTDITASISNGINFGYKYDMPINDSVSVKQFQPTFKIAHEFSIGRSRDRFSDFFANGFFYGPYYQGTDTLISSVWHRNIGNEFSFTYLGLAPEEGMAAKPVNFILRGALKHEIIDVEPRLEGFVYNNLSVRGFISSNPMSESNFLYQAKTKYYLSGYNSGDFHLSGMVGFDFGKVGKLTAHGALTTEYPDWLFASFYFDSTGISNGIKPLRSTTLGAQYSLEQIGLKLSADYHTIGNYTYWNPTVFPVQLDTTMHVISLGLIENIELGALHFDNNICLQLISDEDLLRLPQYYSRHSLYVEGALFNNALYAQFGADVEILSSYAAPAYMPVVAELYQQNELKMGYYPIVDVFLNMQIKTARLFLKMTNITEGLQAKGYYSAYRQPGRGRSFQAGVRWKFFD